METQKAQAPQDAALHFLDYWRIIRIRKTVILAVFFLVVITATVVTFMLPESFASTAKIRVDKDQSDISLQQPLMANTYDPFLIQTETEVIGSEITLRPVIEKFHLMQQWEQPNLQATMEVLRRRFLDVRPVRNTSLIEIRVMNRDRNMAAQLANEIAATYQTNRVKERETLTGGGVKALLERVTVLDEEVARAQKTVEDLRVSLGITDQSPSADAPTPIFTADSLRHLESVRIETSAELVRQRTLLEELKKVASSPEELAQAIPTTGVQDILLTSLLQELTIAEQKLVSLMKEYGEKNSEVTKVAAQVDDLKAKVKDRVSGFIAGLSVKVTSIQNSLQDLETQVAKAKEKDIAEATKSRPYWEAKRKLEQVQRTREMLVQKAAFEQTELKLPKTSMVTIVEPAVPSMTAFTPRKGLNITLGVIIGLVVGVGLAFFIEYLDTSVKTIDDVERSLGAPVLGVIPQNVGILINEGAESPHAEAYRVLRTNLLFSRKDEKLNSVAIVSAGAGEGKSTTVFNLATVFAQSGQRVLVVDSDLRRPTLHKMIKVTNSIGLTNYLLKQNTLEEVIQTTSLPTLDFLASGKLPSSSLGILSSTQMRDLINELKQHYDYVFFDSPPVMGVSDASILASEVDMTIQVIQYRRYPQPMNIRAKQLIEKVGGNLVGIVLNNINMSQDESYYYYSGYYHDYYSKNEEEPAGAPSGAKKSA